MMNLQSKILGCLFIPFAENNTVPDDLIIDPISEFVSFLKIQCGLTSYASRITWENALATLLDVMYDSIMEADPPVQLKKEGYCIIDPSITLEPQCEAYQEPSPETDPFEREIKSRISLVKNFWMHQWLGTEGLVDWPKFPIINGVVQPNPVGGGEAIPGFWAKLWNTFFGYTPTPESGIEIPKGGTVDFIQGFILPKAKGSSYDVEILDTYAFMRTYGMPVIRSKPKLLSSQGWEDMKREQWAAYMEWVQINVRAMNELPSNKYKSPGEYMEDAEGNPMLEPLSKTKRLINAYPVFGVFASHNQTEFRWLFNPGEWFEELFGTTAYTALRMLAEEAATLIINTFKQLLDAFGGIEGLWKIMLMGGIIVAGVVTVSAATKAAFGTLNDKQVAHESRKRNRSENNF
jgi:hypothetical protein